MDSRTTRPGFVRLESIAQWVAHIGGGMAFLAAFGALYIMCGAVAAGFDPEEALLMDVAAFVCGLGLLAMAAAWRNMIARFNRRASISCNFARKAPVPETQMARMPEHPGHLVADIGLPVPT